MAAGRAERSGQWQLACPHVDAAGTPLTHTPTPRPPLALAPAPRIAKTKQATAAGAAVAKGVATGMQAATVEIGTSLMNVVSGGEDKKKGEASSSGLLQQPGVKAVGGIGMEILRVGRAGRGWVEGRQGARAAGGGAAGVVGAGACRRARARAPGTSRALT
jgi:hypothetical protein